MNQDGFIGVDDVTLVDIDNLNGLFGYYSTDLNGDGFTDVLTTSAFIFAGSGDGSFVGPAAAPQIGAPTYVLDVNNDGRADLVSKNGDQIFVYPGNGDFTFGARTTLSAGIMAEAMITADFNGDGLVDIAATSKDFQQRISVFINQGGMAFSVMRRLRCRAMRARRAIPCRNLGAHR